MSKALSEVKTGDVRRPIKKPIKRLTWYTHHRDYRTLPLSQ